MAVMGRHADPWGEEASFEQMATSPAATQVKKAVSDATKAILSDIKEQITSPKLQEPKNSQIPNSNNKNIEEIKKDNNQKLAETRQNLQQINAEIKKAREDREKKYQERLKKERKEQEKKMAEVQQKRKQEDSLQASIRRSQGSGERGKVAG